MQERSGDMPDERSGSKEAGRAGVSIGRKLRLAGLICLLLVVAATWYAMRQRDRRAREERARELAEGIGELRQIVPRLAPDMPRRALEDELARAGQVLVRMEELDPGNPEVAALTVPLLYRAGDVRQAIQTYNSLGPGSAGADYRRASLALADFHLLIVDAARADIGPDGLRYLAGCSLLWDIARGNAGNAATDTDRALAVCSWMARNLGATDLQAVPVGPSVTCGRGYGSPVEMAWTFAELLRQLGVPSHVLAPADEEQEQLASYIVQVAPRDGEPILVDTTRCVPLLEPEAGEPVQLAQLREDADLRRRLAEQMGDEAGALDYIPDARPVLALHPYACYRRFMALDKLLSGLPDHPRSALDFALVPATDVPELWRAPVGIALLMLDERYPGMSYADLAPLDMMPQRDAQLRGAPRIALAEYEQLGIRLRDELARAGAEEGTRTLSRALEMAAFFEAAAVLEAGDLKDAIAGLRRFRREQAESRFAAPSAVLLAEALEAAGEKDAAAEAWRQVPPPRSLYARLRLEGAVPGPALPSPEAPPD